MEYILKNNKLIVSFTSMGGALTSIKNNEGLEYLWQGDESYWSGQAPVLFPICGSLRNNVARNSTGEQIQMSRHGIVRKREFICEKHTDSEIIFSISSDENTLNEYPYQFKLYIQYILLGNQIITQYIIQNFSQKRMPFFIGGHPGFNCPLNSDLDFSDYQVIFEKNERNKLPDNVLENGLVDRKNLRLINFDGKSLPLQHELFINDALIFYNSNSKKAKLISNKDKHSVEIYFDDFDNLLVWSTANKGKFIALEPMTGTSTFLDENDIFEDKAQVKFLEVSETLIYNFTLKFT